MAEAQWLRSREIVERIFVRGTLTLETPAQFGGTGAEGTTDMPLLYDPRTGTTPLLTGASIAGALRAYLREVEQGFEWAEKASRGPQSSAELLFGHLDDREDDKRASVASWLAVDDALSKLPRERPVEFRDGVAIDPASRTAKLNEQGRGMKYDMELLPAGTTFPLCFELWLSGSTQERKERLQALATALSGLERGEIALGRRKRRGLGQCRVSGWQLARYDMATADGLLGWLRHNRDSSQKSGNNIADLLGVSSTEDCRARFTIEATFALEGSLLVRSYSGERDAPDMVHLQSWRNDGEQPVLPGTSLAGALRARALRIANTCHPSKGNTLVAAIFGSRDEKTPTGSRLVVRERVVQNSVTDRVQSRVKIDRFTGGSYPQALFDQMALWGKKEHTSTLELSLELRRSHDPAARDDARIGLLLLVLKDLWTGDLPLGGESSVGRGRLRGLSATIRDGNKQWTLGQEGERVAVNDAETLEGYVKAFVDWRGA